MIETIAPEAEAPEKKKKQTSPVQHSLSLMRNKHGAMIAKVEKWQIRPKQKFGVRVDLFGFIDLIAVVPGKIGCTAIQCCAASGMSAHIHKVMDEEIFDDEAKMKIPNPVRERAIKWCNAGNRLLFHGWKKNNLNRLVLDERELIKTPLGWDVVKAGQQIGLAAPKSEEKAVPEKPF